MVKNDQVAEENIGQVFKYVWSNFSVYFPLLMGSALIVILLYGVQSWGIEFLTRVHSWERAEAGRKFGLMMLISGSIGVISGPILEKYLNKLKVNAATLIVCLISAIALTILGPYTFLILGSNMVISGLFLIMFFVYHHNLPMYYSFFWRLSFSWIIDFLMRFVFYALNDLS